MSLTSIYKQLTYRGVIYLRVVQTRLPNITLIWQELGTKHIKSIKSNLRNKLQTTTWSSDRTDINNVPKFQAYFIYGIYLVKYNEHEIVTN